jgi:hypothetical protein
LSNARDSFDFVEDFDRRVVVQKVLVDPWVGAKDIDVHEHARHVLHDDHTFALNDIRQIVFDHLRSIVNVHDRHVGVGTRFKNHLNGSLPCAGGIPDHVTHVGNPVDGLLEQHQGGVDEDLCASTRVRYRNANTLGGDRRELRYREDVDCQSTHEQNQERNDDCQSWPMQKF